VYNKRWSDLEKWIYLPEKPIAQPAAAGKGDSDAKWVAFFAWCFQQRIDGRVCAMLCCRDDDEENEGKNFFELRMAQVARKMETRKRDGQKDASHNPVVLTVIDSLST
jgi:hypothetical protein